MTEDHHDGETPADGEHGHGHEPRRESGHTSGHTRPTGLAVAANGLRLATPETRISPGTEREWSYTVRDETGGVVTAFEPTHDRLAHLILVRRDLTRFQHCHPELGEDGTWSVTFGLPDPGVYRAYVDVLVEGQPTTLGVDLFASGPADYGPRPGSTSEATADGYRIVMSPEPIAPNEETTLEFEIRRDGDPVRLEPYLGALGHLVALRDGDLAYLHVHPEATAPEAGTVRFAVRFPAAGRYRLFLQAKPGRELLTTSFDVHLDGE